VDTRKIILVMLLALLFSIPAQALQYVEGFKQVWPVFESSDKDYSFSWSANEEPVEGYKLYYKKGGSSGPPFGGTDAAEGPSPINVGKVTSATISGVEDDTTYHFALTAYNGSEESDFTDVITVFP
jgi:hypothetical protein